LSEEERISSGVTEDMIRISVGTEHIDDIIHDFEQSFAKSVTKHTNNNAVLRPAVETDGHVGDST